MQNIVEEARNLKSLWMKSSSIAIFRMNLQRRISVVVGEAVSQIVLGLLRRVSIRFTILFHPQQPVFDPFLSDWQWSTFKNADFFS
jgi:hypothetical protein